MFKIGILLYSIVQFAAFLLILVGTSIDMFHAKKKNQYGYKSCMAMWGMKLDCNSTEHDVRNSALYSDCTGRRDRFRAAQAFAIINIAVYGAACLLGFIMLCCCMCLRWVCLVLNIVGITAAVSWAIMADAYSSESNHTGDKNGNCDKLKLQGKYGAGLALLVTAWCLDIVNIIFLMLPF